MHHAHGRARQRLASRLRGPRRRASGALAAVLLLLGAAGVAAVAEQLPSMRRELFEDAPRRMLREALAPDGGIAPAPGAAAPALAPQGAVAHRLHRNASRTNSTSSSSSSSSSDAALSAATGASPWLGDKLRLGLVFAFGASLFAFCFFTLTPNYYFCPTFPPLLLIFGSTLPGAAA